MKRRKSSSSFSLLSPVFWIAITALTMTYGPVVYGRLRGTIPPQELKNRLLEKSPGPLRSVLGEQKQSDSGTISTASTTSVSVEKLLPPIPKSPQEIPQFFEEAVKQATQQIIEKGNTQVIETRQEVTKNVCTQIVKAIETQCGGGISTSQ